MKGKFAPDVQQAIDDLKWCDVVLFVFPLYWFNIPAVLKGYLDRVLGYYVAYGGQNKAFEGKKMCLSVTTGAPTQAWTPEGWFALFLHFFMKIYSKYCTNIKGGNNH